MVILFLEAFITELIFALTGPICDPAIYRTFTQDPVKNLIAHVRS
jgi:hypothetical protein